MANHIRRIVKVGGSLLDWPPLPRAFHHWIEAEPPALNILVCGGGPFVAEIRRLDHLFALGEEISHWRSIDAMSLTARLVADVLGDVQLVRRYRELFERADEKSPGVV